MKTNFPLAFYPFSPEVIYAQFKELHTALWGLINQAAHATEWGACRMQH